MHASDESSSDGRRLTPVLGTWQLWGLAVGLVISGEYFGWSYGWAQAGTLGFLVTTLVVAVMYTSFIFSFTVLTTAIPDAGGPFAYARRAFGPLGGAIAGWATLIEFVFAPPAIALAIGAYVGVQFPGLEPTWTAVGAYAVFMTLNILGVTFRGEECQFVPERWRWIGHTVNGAIDSTRRAQRRDGSLESHVQDGRHSA